jgi:hypothetical protein
MSEIEGHYYAGMRCDSNGCRKEITGPETHDQEVYVRMALDAGWTIWAGRSRRTYCPEHGPRPGHKMWQVSR